ncbi:MAG: helix-turn-helix domain-containing protein [Chloroflexi bacterium]|nr:helix-turn-helix domain-containing protein [Chloroflexota bacterium]
MATVERRFERGRDQALRIARSTGTEIRLTRRGAGLSLRVAAQSVGLSESVLSRLERGRLTDVSVAQLALACAAVGLRFSARAYPDGDPVRDVAHTTLLQRLRSVVNPHAGWRTEVPLPIPGDLRSWDAQIRFGSTVVAVEAEVRLADLQALERRIALKRRDGGVEIVVLLVADTHGNRRVLAAHRDALRAGFPLSTRATLASLREGLPPVASGIVVL